MKKWGVFFGQNKGQVTVFIIIAVLILAAAGAYFLLRGSIGQFSIPPNIQPAYTSFLSCLEEDTLTGISVLESQGGYISLPDFEPGSQYMPFSSQLDFLGNLIPYWYYVSGNNIQKEQVPTKEEMEQQIGNFVASRMNGCNFNSYYEQGFEISLAEPTAIDVSIKDGEVEISIDANLNIAKENESALVKNHKVVVNSELGKLYASAKKVYDEEQNNLFLEERAVDTLRSYAPVDGVEITCSPLVWNANDVFDDLQEAIEANTIALGDNIVGNEDNYFNVKIPNVGEEVRFLNSRNWPSGFEVTPSDGAFLISNPVGNQAGLGILGFCYVPYHFVYNVRYPVLVQVYSDSGDEIFQFPMAVVLQNNNPRVSLNVSAVEDVVPDLCTYKNTQVEVIVKDLRGAPVKADISYECLGNRCSIGETSDSGTLDGVFPQCVNGYVVAKAPGFKDMRYLFSTTLNGSVSVLMEKLYDKKVQLKINGVNYNGDAIVYFTSPDVTQTIVYPQQKNVQLAEGQYQVQVYIYRNSSINIGATVTEQCIDVPRSGPLGLFGLQEKKCFDIQVPAQVISNALSGGGKEDYYVLESDLIRTGVLEINSKNLPIPDTIEKLQDNYALFEENGLDVDFR